MMCCRVGIRSPSIKNAVFSGLCVGRGCAKVQASPSLRRRAIAALEISQRQNAELNIDKSLPSSLKMTESLPEFVEIYRPKNLMQAHAIRMALEDAGVDVRIEGELLQSAVGEIPLGWDTLPRIMVDSSQLNTAREIVERSDARAAAEPPGDETDERTRCLACGCEMAETETTCASCGWTFLEEATNALGDSP